MNWRLWFLRVWLVATAVWISVCMSTLDVLFDSNPFRMLVIEHRHPLTYGYGAMAVAFGVPVLALAVGLAVGWIVKGFRPTT